MTERDQPGNTIVGGDMGFRRWLVAVGNSPLYVYEALWTLGLFEVL